jgi:hypothetical protein
LLVSIGQTGTIIAGIANLVAILVGLGKIRLLAAIVNLIVQPIAITIGIAGIAKSIAVLIMLIEIGDK